MITDKQIFDQISDKLFPNGCCEHVGEWIEMTLEIGGQKARFEAMQPSRGNIKIRKMKKETHDGHEFYIYLYYRFTNKCELVDTGWSLVNK